MIRIVPSSENSGESHRPYTVGYGGRSSSHFVCLSRMVLLICMVVGIAQSGIAQTVYKGKVVAKGGAPIPGVQIQVKLGRAGTISRPDGSFQISASQGNALVFKILGFKKLEVTLGAQTDITAPMEEDILQLEEAVVTAVGITQEKKALSYATQEIKATEFTQNRQTNLLNALQGSVAGAQINSSAGTPGAGTSIRLRGFASITGNNSPLFVIDGVPIDNSDVQAGGSAGVDNSNRAIDLNPDDIESVNVLKGSAATALYGLQAGAGAIIITTKRARNDSRFQVNYSYTMTFDEVNKLPPTQMKFSQGLNGAYQGPETAQGRSWGAALDTLFWTGANDNDWDANGQIIGASRRSAFPNARPVTAYDNIKDFYRVGRTDIHSFNMQGGNRDASFFLSVLDSRSSGIIPNSKFDKTTLRLNAEYKLTDELRVEGNVQYIRSVGRRTERGNNVGGVSLALFRTPITFDNANRAAGVTEPWSDPRAFQFADGSQRTYRGYGIYDNPYWIVSNNLWNDRTDRTIGKAQVNWEPKEGFLRDIGLNVTYRLGGDFYTTAAVQNSAINSVNAPSGSISYSENRSQIINSDLIIRLQRDNILTEGLNASLLVGNNAFENYSDASSTFASNLVIPGFYNISNAADPALVRQTNNIKRTGAWYGNLSLDYKGLIIFNGTLRNEWTTTLARGSNSFLYGSGSAALILTEALGFKDDEVFSFGKLRASLAFVGQDAPIYSLNNTFVQSTFFDGWGNSALNFPINGVAGFRSAITLGNPLLRPEKRREFEIGAEFKFFLNRINLDITYYNTENSDLILTVPQASSTGYQQRLVNAATMNNRGIEVMLRSILYENRDQDLSVDLTVNFSTFRSIVSKLADGVPSYALPGGFGVSYAVEGQPYGTAFGGGFVRDAQGRAVIGANGFPTVDDTSRSLGANIPDFILQPRLTVAWKGFSITALLDWKKGGLMWNGTRAALNSFGKSAESEQRGPTAGRTISTGDLTIVDGVFQGVNAAGQPNTVRIADIGRNWWGNAGIFNNFNSPNLVEPFMEDAGWIRLREVTVSYALPQDVLHSLGFLQSASVFFTGRNLWLKTNYTGVDPETNLTGASGIQGNDYFNTVGTRSYSFGIRVGF